MANATAENSVRPFHGRVLTDSQKRRIGAAQGARLLQDRLRRIRVDAGLSQTELAEAVGVSNRDSVRRWERGDIFPSAEVLVRIMIACGVTDVTDLTIGHR